uniref:AraC family transcriptional regulator n=1 Tax=Panagrolaimus sp. PS1159 TaxID=55785 RepID=A0AC35G0R6_9BILA
MKTFSSIQNLNFKVNYSFGCGTFPDIPDKTIIHFHFDNKTIIHFHFDSFNSFITERNLLFKIPGGKWCNFPPKITYFVVNWEEATNVDQLKATFAEFEFDENEKEYVCFRQNIETWMPKSTVFEIRFVK